MTHEVPGMPGIEGKLLEIFHDKSQAGNEFGDLIKLLIQLGSWMSQQTGSSAKSVKIIDT